ncbi:hypothetical protein M569_09165, partial [Genlisea aurea]
WSRKECIMTPVRYFVVISLARSGTGWFISLLNNHTSISSNSEIFLAKDRTKNLVTIIETLDKVYNMDFNENIVPKNECVSAVGFVWMLNQDLFTYHQEIVSYFKRKGVLLIFLFRRNLLR